MISFAVTGPDGLPAVIPLRPGREPLTQHWVQAGQLAGPALTPSAGLDLRADGVMVFSAAMQPAPQDTFAPGLAEFADGLWKGNVVEWFLGHPETGRYLEVHLAPSGRWWACPFASVRVREIAGGRPLPLSVIRHRRDKAGRHWEATVQVPSSVLCRLLGVSSVLELRTNLAAVVHPATGQPLYFSRAPLPGPGPNFHQPGAWLRMSRG